MQSTMMDVPLTVPMILERARTLYAEREVVSLLVGGLDESGKPVPRVHRSSYGAVARRSLQLANALTDAGLQPGDRVATLAVNSFRHLEAYLGVPSAGFVLHTVNVRLHPEQICYILNHAGDRVLLIENAFAAVIPQIRAGCPQLERIYVFGPTPQPIPGAEDYDAWISPYPDTFSYPQLNETDGAAMCYTSGTTGNPKGVVYSHRSTVLHSLVSAPKDGLDVGEGDRVLPVVPMFHVNAWGLPYTCAMFGAAQIYAGVFTDGPTLARTLQDERVTITAGVPTIWMGLLNELDRAAGAGTPYDLGGLSRLIVGGSAAPEALIRAFRERHGLKLAHAWGMTETHPLGTSSTTPPDVDELSELGYQLQAKQGRPVPLVELKLVSDDGEPLPHDGQTMGRLLARGPWITGRYYGGEGTGNFLTLDGVEWFDTGDIATMDARGFMHIQDRAKDLIKSGGEWISSVELENALMAHPAVAQAAVIAVAHAKWDERPLAVVVLRDGMSATEDELTAFLAPRFAKWWLPDGYAFAQSIPLNAAGKFVKRDLREQYAGFELRERA